MSAKDDKLTDFERRLRLTLEESVNGVDARVRSRLNQARQAAVEEAGRPGRSLRRVHWMPALGAVTAALLVALVLGYQAPRPVAPPSVDSVHPTMEDLDLLADSEGMDLVQSDDGAFYEWAMAQAEGGEAPAIGSGGNGV
jgi:hypothetical protein